MAAKSTVPAQMSSRRATQLSIQRLMTSPGDVTSTMPSMCHGLGHSIPSALKLPSLLSPMTATSATSPACLHCENRISWGDWYEDANVLNIGPGKFYARCALCRANDASFKDGPASG
jgi:hypothetical protein